MAKLNIGDTVRFLNAKGGGIVRRIVGKVAWVEGEDGFELPTPVHECIPVNDKDTFVPAYRTPQEIREEEERRKQARLGSLSGTAPTTAPTPKVVTPPAPHLLLPERIDGDLLSIYLAWLPEDFSSFSNGDMECYLINDTNYTLFYTYALALPNGMFRLVASGEIERDTKLLVDTFSLTEINDREHIHLSILPYKRENKYVLKEPLSIDYKPDGLKFFKRHCFIDNDFFDEDALVVPLIEKDVLKVKQPKVTVEEVSKAPIPTARRNNQPARVTPKKQYQQPNKQDKNTPLVIDLLAPELLPSTQGLSPRNILDYQLEVVRSKMYEQIRNKGAKIIFIHGKGDGILRKAILDLLTQKYPRVITQDASSQEYGDGAILVQIN